MSQDSIQIKRIAERVNRFYKRFGYRTHAKIQSNQAWVYGNKELGFDQAVCRIAETARGTAIGFFPKNTWQNFTVFIPFILGYVLLILNEFEFGENLLTGENTLLGYNYLTLFLGDASLTFLTTIVFIIVPAIFAVVNYIIQDIRIYNLKGRFPFFTRDAIWEPRDLSATQISIKASMTGFFHGWMVAILYFAALSMGGDVINDITTLYGIQLNAFKAALIEGFAISGGLITGLITSQKSILLRKELQRTDNSLKFSGGLSERRLETILYGISSALYAAVIQLIFFSFTFLKDGTMVHTFYFVFGAIIGGAAIFLIQEENPIWFASTYGVFLFFSSLILIFRTGSEAGFAFVVILQIIIIPLSFLLVANLSFEYVMKKYNIKTYDGIFNLSPLKPLISVFMARRQRKEHIREYEAKLAEDNLQLGPDVLVIDRMRLDKIGENALRVARHYYELLGWYNAKFDEDLVFIPKPSELNNWWTDRTGKPIIDGNTQFITIADKLIWDYEFVPSNAELEQIEAEGKRMVLAIQ